MLNLTQRTRELLAQNQIELQLIVEVDGIDLIFGASPVKSLWKIGDANIRIGDPLLYIGGIVTNPKSVDLIDPTQSTRTITQQMEIERGVTSVSGLKVRLLDRADIATELFTPDVDKDILGRGCTVYLAVAGASHPEDSIRVFDGVIDECAFGAGYCDLSISHPEQFKRQAILPKWESELVTAIPSGSVPSSVYVTSMDGLTLLPSEQGAYTYFRLDKEIMSFNAIDPATNKLSSFAARNMFASLAQLHAIGGKIESFYYFDRNPIELALMLLCSRRSDESQYYVEDIEIHGFRKIYSSDFPFRIECNASDIIKYNIQIGDKLRIFAKGTGTHEVDNAENPRFFDVSKIEFSGNEAYLYTPMSGSGGPVWVEDLVNLYSFSAISKWNLLPDGCGIPNRFIDFEGLDAIRIMHASELAPCQVFIKDTITDTKDFIDQVILRPQGLYTLPKKGRISIGKTIPPVANKETKVLNERNILNANSLKIGRSINRNFYNAVIYKYHEDAIEDKLLSGELSVDADSISKIKVGNRPLLIEARSLRKGADSSKVIRSQSRRLLDRYRFGAEVIRAEVDFETGVNIDVGDTAVCLFKNLKVADITNKSRQFVPRLMEVTNKTLNIARGEVSLELTNTVFEVDGRYATITPSSRVASGSTATVIRLDWSFSRWAEGNEKGKWEQYIDQKIMLRSSDWGQVHHSTIKALDDTQDAIIIEPLGVTPSAGWIVEAPLYDDNSAQEMSFWKQIHAFLNPAVAISSVTSSTVIQVGSGEGAKFLPGAVIVVHSADFSSKSSEVKILSVNGDQLTLASALSYTPSAGHLIQLIGFKDGGHPYRIV
jgi:hypothetical protein